MYPYLNNFDGSTLLLLKTSASASSGPIASFTAKAGIGANANLFNSLASNFEKSFCFMGVGETRFTGPTMS